MRGQIAFETLIILLVVFSAAIMLGSYYLTIHNETIALEAARTETLRQIGVQSEFIIIESVHARNDASGTIITIDLTPEKNLDITAIANKAKQASKIQTLSVEII